MRSARPDEKVSLLLDVRDNRTHNAHELSIDIKVDGKEFPGCTVSLAKTKSEPENYQTQVNQDS